MKITKQQLMKIIKEELTDHWDDRDKIAMSGAVEGGPTSAQEWLGWGESFGLAPEYDEDGQLVFYLSRDSRDPNRAAAEAVRAGAKVDTDQDGNDMIYTGVTGTGPMGETNTNMRITREQLIKIIKEEYADSVADDVNNQLAGGQWKDKDNGKCYEFGDHGYPDEIDCPENLKERGGNSVKEEYAAVNELGPETGHEEGTNAIDIVKQIGDDLIEVAGEMREMPSHVPASNVAGFIESKGKEALEAHAELAGGAMEETVIQESELDMEDIYSNVLLPALRKADVDMWSYGDVFKAAMRIHYEQVTDMMSKGQ